MQFTGNPRAVDKRWFLGVSCRKCKAPILFARDLTDGKSKIARAGKLVLTCAEPNCGLRADYSGAKVSRFQKSAKTQ